MKTILLLTDFSKRAERAAKFALELALTNKADVLLYNSIIMPEYETTIGARQVLGEEFLQKKDKSMKNLAELSGRLNLELNGKEQFVPQINYINGTGPVADTIRNLVTEHEIWMIVMGSHINDELRDLYLGSNLFPVISNSSCPVLLVP